MNLTRPLQRPSLFLCLGLVILGFEAQQLSAAETTRAWKKMSWAIDGVNRAAFVSFPESSKDPTSPTTKTRAPLMFVFHGHGGTAKRMAGLGFGKLWCQSIVVCPQGLPTVTGRDPAGERSGWQTRKKPEEQSHAENRDLKFFDRMLAAMLTEHDADPERVFVTGHSNGGGFTYYLLAHRSEKLCAIAPSAAGAAALREGKNAQPIPLMHIAGKADPIVKFANQQRTLQMICRHWDCVESKDEYRASKKLSGRQFRQKNESTHRWIVFIVHEGGHRYHAESPEAITGFFKNVIKNESESENTGG